MCKLQIESNGYRLKSGKIVTPDKLEDLTNTEVEELLSTNISAWEFLMLRKSNHHLVNAINGLTGNIQERIANVEDVNKTITGSLKRIEDSLFVETVNGERKKRGIGEVVVELWNFHKSERNAKELINVIIKYRFPIVMVLGISLGLSVKFHNVVNLLLNQVEDWVFVATGSVVFIAVLAYLLKLIFDKKLSKLSVK